MRIVCCSGVSPLDFYDLTIDEALISYRGKVDEWRFFRNGFNLVHCSLVQNPVEISGTMPLPFDEEQTPSEYDIIEDYKRNWLKDGG